MRSSTFTASQIVFIVCLAFIAGIFFSYSRFIWSKEAIIGVAVALLLGILFKSRVFILAGVALFAVFTGMALYGAADNVANASDVVIKLANGATHTISGVVVREPTQTETKLQLVVAPHNMKSGYVLVSTTPFTQVLYGDEVQVTGIIERPVVFPDFNYAAYLARSGIYATTRHARVYVTGHNKLPGIIAPLLSFKASLRNVLQKHIPPPQSSLLAAMVLGDKGAMPKDLKSELSIAGVRHITAISGMHIAVLASLLLSLFLALGMWKKHAVLLAICAVAIFVALTGFQVSAIRAGLMGSAVLGIGAMAGRKISSLRLLVFTAAGMLAVAPLAIGDLGFQLSFLAILGIVLTAPFFERQLINIPMPLSMRQIFAMSIAAQVFTWPLLLMAFHQLSIVSIAANMVIVPLLPAILALGLLFLLSGALWSVAGAVLAIPMLILLNIVLGAVRTFSIIPGAALPAHSIILWSILITIITAVVFVKIKEQRAQKEYAR